MLDLLHPRHALVAYVYIVLVAMIFRYRFIIQPLWRAYDRFAEGGIVQKSGAWIGGWLPWMKVTEEEESTPRIGRVGRLKILLVMMLRLKDDSQLKGIERFLAIESLMILAPISAALVLRLLLGQPIELEWTRIQFIIAITFATIWLSIDIRKSHQISISLRKLESNYADPDVLRYGFQSILWTRDKLVSLSEWEPEKVEIEPAEDKPSDVESSTLAKSAQEMASAAVAGVKRAAAMGVTTIDDQLQAQVDKVTGRSRLASFTRHTFIVLSPLFMIYGVLPWLG
jgi:hypothetical protein